MRDSDKIVVYTSKKCLWCRTLKEFLKRHEIEFEERRVDLEEKYRLELLKRAGEVVVPIIEAGESTIFGFDRKEIIKTFGL